MTRSSDTGRLHRSFAGVESTYVLDLGRHEPSRTRTRPPTAGHQARRAADRIEVARRRVDDSRLNDSRLLARR